MNGGKIIHIVEQQLINTKMATVKLQGDGINPNEIIEVPAENTVIISKLLASGWNIID
jgi:hypothetical protein